MRELQTEISLIKDTHARRSGGRRSYLWRWQTGGGGGGAEINPTSAEIQVTKHWDPTHVSVPASSSPTGVLTYRFTISSDHHKLLSLPLTNTLARRRRAPPPVAYRQSLPELSITSLLILPVIRTAVATSTISHYCYCSRPQETAGNRNNPFPLFSILSPSCFSPNKRTKQCEAGETLRGQINAGAETKCCRVVFLCASHSQRRFLVQRVDETPLWLSDNN